MTRYIVDWSDDDGNVDSMDADSLADAKRKAAAKSKVVGMAYVVAMERTGLDTIAWASVGCIGYARGRIDTKEGVLK